MIWREHLNYIFNFTKFFSYDDNISIKKVLYRNELTKISFETTIKLLEFYEQVKLYEKIKLSLFKKTLNIKIVDDSIYFERESDRPIKFRAPPIGIYKFKNSVGDLHLDYYIIDLYKCFEPNFGIVKDVNFYLNRREEKMIIRIKYKQGYNIYFSFFNRNLIY